MRLLVKIFTYLILTLLIVIVLLPKTQGYYYLENVLKKQNIIISNETNSDLGLSFHINNANIYYNKMKVCKLEKSFILFTLFYNHLNISDVKISNDFAQFIPQNIENISFSHHIFLPHKISMHANGDFGLMNGWVDLWERKIYILLKPSAKLITNSSFILQSFKKTPDGNVYERSF